jgi:hypothetical protein
MADAEEILCEASTIPDIRSIVLNDRGYDRAVKA